MVAEEEGGAAAAVAAAAAAAQQDGPQQPASPRTLGGGGFPPAALDGSSRRGSLLIGGLAGDAVGGPVHVSGGSFWGAASALPLVLCVDDDEVNQLVLQGMLHSQDYGWAPAGLMFGWGWG